MNEAFAVTGISTKRELVQTALRELIRIRKEKNMSDLAGEIDFVEGFDHKKLRKTRYAPTRNPRL